MKVKVNNHLTDSQNYVHTTTTKTGWNFAKAVFAHDITSTRIVFINALPMTQPETISAVVGYKVVHL